MSSSYSKRLLVAPFSSLHLFSSFRFLVWLKTRRRSDLMPAQDPLADALNITHHGESSKGRIMGVAYAGWEKKGESKGHLRNFAFAIWKKKFSLSNLFWCLLGQCLSRCGKGLWLRATQTNSVCIVARCTLLSGLNCFTANQRAQGASRIPKPFHISADLH